MDSTKKEQNIFLTLGNTSSQSLPSKWLELLEKPFNLISYKTYLKAIEKIRNKSIVFVGCIRDIEQSKIEANISRLRQVSALFSSCSHVFVINDTSVKLPAEFKVIQCDFSIPRLGGGRDARRIEWMSIFRNIYLNYVRSQLSDYDYMAVIDMDISDFSVPGLISSFGYEDWNCMSSNGIQYLENNEVYYDNFSFVDIDFKAYNEDIEVFPLNKLVKSVSGFGGIEIFKIKAIKGKYSGMYFNGNFVCEHSCLNYYTGGHYINTNQLVLR